MPNIEKSEPYPGSYLEATEDLFEVLLSMNFNKWVLDLRNVSMIYNDLVELISLFPENKVIAVSSEKQRWALGADNFGTVVVSPRLYTRNIIFPPEFIIYLEEYISSNPLMEFLDEYPEWSNFNIDAAAKGIKQVIKRADDKYQQDLYDDAFPDLSPHGTVRYI